MYIQLYMHIYIYVILYSFIYDANSGFCLAPAVQFGTILAMLQMSSAGDWPITNLTGQFDTSLGKNTG